MSPHNREDTAPRKRADKKSPRIDLQGDFCITLWRYLHLERDRSLGPWGECSRTGPLNRATIPRHIGHRRDQAIRHTRHHGHRSRDAAAQRGIRGYRFKNRQLRGRICPRIAQNDPIFQNIALIAHIDRIIVAQQCHPRCARKGRTRHQPIRHRRGAADTGRRLRAHDQAKRLPRRHRE